MHLNVVLVEPQIPQNTGNIARLTAATSCTLHLVEPLAFEISDKNVKRAGLDYWPEVRLETHQTWESFLAKENPNKDQLWLLSTKAEIPYHQAEFSEHDYLVFGSETTGLSEEIHQTYPQSRLRIPIDNPKVRSLNLANAVAIVVYEARRQLQFKKNT